MADSPSLANEGRACEADVHEIQRTDITLPRVRAPPQSAQQRPKSSHCDFRESRRWAKRNAEWIDNGNGDVQHPLAGRRTSEDLLQSQHLQAASLTSETERHTHHQRSPSDTGSLEQVHNLNCLSRTLSTGNWLKVRRDAAQRKIHVHHQLGRFVKKITDTSNWASKEPTASLDGPEGPTEGDSLTQTVLKTKPKKSSTRRVAKLSKKPGMDNIRAQKEAADNAQNKPNELNADGIINLNATEDTSSRPDMIPALREEDIEDTKRRSADLREILSEYQSDRHGNLLPEINTDTISDFGAVAQRYHEQRAHSESEVGPLQGLEQHRGVDLIENSAWKTSNPSSGKYLPNTSLSPPQPGPRISSRHGAFPSSTVRCVEASSPVARSAVYATAQSSPMGSPDSFKTVVEPLKLNATQDPIGAPQLRGRTSTDALPVFEAPLTKSTDTLTAITNEALGQSQPLTPSNIADTECIALKSSKRPTKLHSGFVSSGRAPGDAPNRPLPDLPEVPSPKSSKTTRRDASSRGSSPSGRSVQRMSTQPGHNGRTSSLASIASLDGVLQETGSHYGSPQRGSKPGKETAIYRPSSQKPSNGLSDLTDGTNSELGSGHQGSEARSPYLVRGHGLPALGPTQDARDTVTRDKQIHDKRLQDITAARARRGKRAIQEDHDSIQEDPAAEDFPPPPSSRASSRATGNRRKSDPNIRVTPANTSAAYLPDGASLVISQGEPTPLAPGSPSLPDRVQISQMNRASTRGRDKSPVLAFIPIRASGAMSRVMEPQQSRQVPKSKQSHTSLRSTTTIAHSHTVRGTQTPPLSESSTPSSDEDGTGVVGASTTAKSKMQKRLHLSTTDFAAMVTDMHAMREQLDKQMREIQSQSKHIRAIQMQKLRMVDAVNALVAVVSEPVGLAPAGGLKQAMENGVNTHLGWRDRDSIASTSNTAASGDSASSKSGSSDATFITEPDTFVDGGAGAEGMEFNMDFDRMQELIRLDRRKVGSGLDRDAKGKMSRRKRSGGAVGYLSIEA